MEENHLKTAADNGKPLVGRDIICFSHDWTGDPLSKTHLMRILSRDNRILWVNAIANRMPTASGKDIKRIFKKVKAYTESLREVEPNIHVLNPLAIPTYGNTLIRGFNEKFLLSQVKGAMKRLGFNRPINLVFNPAAGLLAGKLGEEEIIYYCVDEYTAFTGVAAGLREIEEGLFQKAGMVIVSAEKLYESKAKYNPNTFIIRHGVDFAHFSKALDNDLPIPAEIAALPKPIIGFHGLLADWIDYDLLAKIARHFSGGSLVLIGKTTVDAETVIKKLDGIGNVHLLGRKPYADLPAYCKGFDVALNPFAINELTLAANPLKVREYLAAGLEVVSTAIPEVEILKFCRIGRTDSEFIHEIEKALAAPAVRKEVSDSIRHESWEARVDELREVINRLK